MKKRAFLLSCVLAIMLGISGALLRNWRQKTIGCQLPFLTTVPSSMPKTVSGLFARIEGTRYWNRSMPIWWEFNPEFPQPDQNYIYSVEEISVLDNEIWTIYDFSPKIQRFNVITGEHDVYGVIDGKEIEWVRHLLVTQDDTVLITAKLDSSYVLARFDKATNAFKMVDGDNPLFTWMGPRPPLLGSNLVETMDGDILIPFDKNIYRYDPAQKFMYSLLPETFEFSVQSLADFENSLWFTVQETKNVWMLDMSTQKLINYGPAPNENYGEIAVDNTGQVWLGYSAQLKRKPNGDYQWYYPKTFPAEFVTLVHPYEDSLSGKGELEYRWSGVSKVFVASDESIWFLAHSGIVKYDPHTGTWCLSAPAHSNSIAESKDGSLWIAPRLPTSQGLYRFNSQQ